MPFGHLVSMSFIEFFIVNVIITDDFNCLITFDPKDGGQEISSVIAKKNNTRTPSFLCSFHKKD